MSFYEIENTTSGQSLGIYEGITAYDAIEAMMADAGHDGLADRDLKATATGTLGDLHRAAREHDGIHAPGSESMQSIAFCEAYPEARSASADETPVAAGEFEFWSLVFAGNYRLASHYGDVPPEWLDEQAERETR